MIVPVVSKYKKKPVVVEAVQYVGVNKSELLKWVNGSGYLFSSDRHSESSLFLKTLEGPLKVSLYDYIIRGVEGEFYPCKPNIFTQTYDKVEV